ncbi:hypothetical protein BUALT_Bualt11G0062100 [Buddleja alternifolia]|uniref:F-box domain-containing protein n=1 Tax=Buddleja alternifolia TaxID=168488 RepID=A0AAV6X3T2_9LAMI|nr:hypothetical protein BUALT_Bualt11G0062100 [Buddleja alternifolia]
MDIDNLPPHYILGAGKSLKESATIVQKIERSRVLLDDGCMIIFYLYDDAKRCGLCVQVCRKWRGLASDDTLWSNLFKKDGGLIMLHFMLLQILTRGKMSTSFKTVVTNRIVIGVEDNKRRRMIIISFQGQIQRHLGSRQQESRAFNLENGITGGEECKDEEEGQCSSILDKILFFIGDMESASVHAKRSRLL